MGMVGIQSTCYLKLSWKTLERVHRYTFSKPLWPYGSIFHAAFIIMPDQTKEIMLYVDFIFAIIGFCNSY